MLYNRGAFLHSTPSSLGQERFVLTEAVRQDHPAFQRPTATGYLPSPNSFATCFRTLKICKNTGYLQMFRLCSVQALASLETNGWLHFVPTPSWCNGETMKYNQLRFSSNEVLFFGVILAQCNFHPSMLANSFALYCICPAIVIFKYI